MKYKFLLTVLCLGLLSIYYGCQKEIEELEGLESSDSELFSTIDFSTFKDNIKHKDIKNSHINKLVNHQTLSFGQLRFKSQPENFIISIDSTDVLMAEKDGVTSYTFKTQTTDMSKTTNYVLAHDEHNNTDEYYLSYGDDGSSTIIDPVSGLSFTSKSRSIWCPISREVWVCVCADHEPGNCVGICTGGFHQITVVTNEPCPSGGGEGSGGGPGDGGTGGNGNGNGEGTGGGSGDGGSGGNDLPIDGPIVTKPRKLEQDYEECLSGNYDSTICDCVAEGSNLEECLFNEYYIFENPDNPIEDIEEYLECFDHTQQATLTIYVDQPIANSDAPFTLGSDKAGHAFIGISQGNVSRHLGLYPNGNATPTNPNHPHVFDDNSNDSFDVSITFNIDAISLQNIIGDAINYPSNYDLDLNNCTDYVINVASICGITLPDPQSNWLGGGGSNPGAFGEALREMELTNGMTRNNEGGVSPQNTGQCN